MIKNKMASEVNVSKKKKKYSKKTKRNWRKQTDIKDVEEYLEEVRRDERTGGSAADKADSSLFFVDTIKLKTPDIDKDESLPKRSRKRKILKQDELLLPDTRIKPVGSKKPKTNKKKTKNEKQIDSESSDEELQTDKNRNQVKPKGKNEQKESRAYFDLWGTEDKPEGDDHYLKVTNKTKIKAPKTAKRKVTELPAVEVAAPGASYNPTFEEHQELLQKAHEVEVKKNKKIDKLNRQHKWLSKEEAADLPSWEEEMSQGLFDEGKSDDDDDDNEEEEEEEDDDDIKPIISSQRKTRQQRRKEKEEKKQQMEQESEKKLKLGENEVFRIKSLKKEIEVKEKKIKQKLKKKEEMKKDELKRPKRLGRHGFEEPSVEIQLSDEITGNLRSITPEGNLFADRFKSLQKRNLIEPRKPVIPHRKYAMKEYVKKSYNQPCVKEIAAEGK